MGGRGMKVRVMVRVDVWGIVWVTVWARLEAGVGGAEPEGGGAPPPYTVCVRECLNVCWCCTLQGAKRPRATEI